MDNTKALLAYLKAPCDAVARIQAASEAAVRESLENDWIEEQVRELGEFNYQGVLYAKGCKPVSKAKVTKEPPKPKRYALWSLS